MRSPFALPVGAAVAARAQMADVRLSWSSSSMRRTTVARCRRDNAVA
ncbi:hypothetical protein ACFV2H_25350 [Streptomyces sp. NPDC059629]